MEHNPLAPALADEQAALARLVERRRKLGNDLRWLARFDAGSAQAELHGLGTRHAALTVEINQVQARLDEARPVLVRLRDQASLGWNPAWWFADERSAAKIRHEEQKALIEELVTRLHALEGELGDVGSRAKRLERDLGRHAKIDASNASERLAQLDGDIVLQELKVEELVGRKQQVDQRLAPLLAQLDEKDREIGSLDRRRGVAERFERQLDSAANGYERSQIHRRCEEELGRSSPRAVVRDVQQRRERLVRDREKLLRRIADEARRSARDIRAVVIDGNNMCYEGNRFIGLTALAPVCEVLRGDYDVTVVFDRSIQTRWRLTEARLGTALRGARVHVVRSRPVADELLLDTARDPVAVVLSNDRFGEFHDKDAVRTGRVVRHDILKGRVSVPDLGIDVPLTATG